MLRTVCDRPTLWEALLPPEALVMPAEFVAVDRLLDDPALFEPFRRWFDPELGRRARLSYASADRAKSPGANR